MNSTVVSTFGNDPSDAEADKDWFLTSGTATVKNSRGAGIKITISSPEYLYQGYTGLLAADLDSSYSETQTEDYSLDIATQEWSDPTLSESGKIKSHAFWGFSGNAAIWLGTASLSTSSTSDVDLNMNFSGTGESRTATGSGTATGKSSRLATSQYGSTSQSLLAYAADGTPQYSTVISSMETRDKLEKESSVNYTLSAGTWEVSGGTGSAKQDSLRKNISDETGSFSESGDIEADPMMIFMMLPSDFHDGGDYSGDRSFSKSVTRHDELSEELHVELSSTWSSSVDEMGMPGWLTTGTSTRTNKVDNTYTLTSSAGTGESYTWEGDSGHDTWEREFHSSENTSLIAHELQVVESSFSGGFWSIQSQTASRQRTLSIDRSSQTTMTGHRDWSTAGGHGTWDQDYTGNSHYIMNGSANGELNLSGEGSIPGQYGSWSLSGNSLNKVEERQQTISTGYNYENASTTGQVSLFDEHYEIAYEGSDQTPQETGTLLFYQISGQWYDTVPGEGITLVEPEEYGYWEQRANYYAPFGDERGWLTQWAPMIGGTEVQISSPGYPATSFGFSTPGSLFEPGGGSSEGGDGGSGEGGSGGWEAPPSLSIGGYFYGVGQVFVGYYNSVANTVSGAYQMVAHPIQTAYGVGIAISHPMETGKAIVDSYVEKSKTLTGQGEIVGEILQLVAGAGASKAAVESGNIAKLGSFLRKLDKAIPGATDELNSASRLRYKIPNRIVQEEVESYITRTFKEFEEAGGQIIEKLDELGPKKGDFRVLATTNVKERTITFYRGAEVQDVVEELLHFKQAVKGGQWGMGGVTK